MDYNQFHHNQQIKCYNDVPNFSLLLICRQNPYMDDFFHLSRLWRKLHTFKFPAEMLSLSEYVLHNPKMSKLFFTCPNVLHFLKGRSLFPNSSLLLKVLTSVMTFKKILLCENYYKGPHDHKMSSTLPIWYCPKNVFAKCLHLLKCAHLKKVDCLRRRIWRCQSGSTGKQNKIL